MPACKFTNQVMVVLIAGMHILLTIVLLGAQVSSPPIKVQIVSDANRDGKVEFDSDDLGKNIWTSTRGAIFFNNNDRG
jgi:hypothetical protein